MSGYPQTPTFPIDLRGGAGIKVRRTGPTANTIVLDAILGNDAMAPMAAGTLKANLLGTTAAPQDVTFSALGAALGLKALAYKDAAAIADVTGLQTALNGKQASLGFTPENVATKGQPNGYVPLGTDGKVASTFLPPGNGGAITADLISDASAPGKAVLKGTPSQARDALLLGGAATLGVGNTAGTVMAGNDARVVNGIRLGANQGADVDWLNFNTHKETVSVNVGGLPDDCFPGGNTVGCYNGILGAIDIKTAGQNNASTFAAAVGGIVRSTMSNPSPCGIFGAAMGNTPDNVYAQIFPANFVVTNQRNLNPYTTSGIKRAEMYGIEIDMEVHPADDGTPMEGHARGIWITGNSRVQPTGEFTGVLIGPAGILRTPRIPWKKAFRSQLGAAQIAFEAGELLETGACSSQPIIMIGRNGAGQSLTTSLLSDQDGNLLARIPGAALVIQNAGASTAITLRTDGRIQAINADLSSNLTVGGNAAVNGTLTASTTNTGSLNVSSNAGVGGNLTVNGSATAGTGSFGSM